MIVDTMLAPAIGPSPEPAALLPYARQLDEHVLFPTAGLAQAFHDWYMAAEPEHCGNHVVIRVDAP